jgi:hypothetical protein
VSRAQFATELIKSGAPQPLARCVAGKVVGAYSIEQLSSNDPSRFQSPDFVRQVQSFAAACR